MYSKEFRCRRWVRSLVISPLIFLVALYVLLEEFIETVVKPLVERVSNWRILQRIEKFLHKRNPYTLFAIYSVKLILFSSIKFLSLYWISQGRIYGPPLLITGELCGAALTVWYAKVALPALLTLRWFAAGYQKAVMLKNLLLSKLKAMRAYQYAKYKAQQVRHKLRDLKQYVLRVSKREGKGYSTLKAMYRFVNRKR
ncbi:hypothetical protein SRRS_43200 [Sporomusa rhizae]|uniref:hypothetical protein n=1 Tax=Sporomusa rhizae TaxID=357999 RepID=UPI00352A18C7